MTTIELEARKVPPCQYTRDEMASILLEREKDTHVYTHEQVKNEMKKLIKALLR